ncbi:LOW QUALITY PROTEIN: hypothetical protein Cgig2_002066 [Carnegiea gigantea]|uniref:Uncharacterized protein n=1 Tax=Carnegiea gigantea TaxID=171969 RepID=A0A9Q1JMK6_9CARY|nr:LOW QUALITY PROTEIN: hypothetical protein Cgig2_002066 [Carnegiea gigantea]
MNSKSDPIVDSILYIESVAEIWKQLKRRFAVSNGARKYKLNKHVYNLKQINEYYTWMRGIWEELSAMNDLRPFSIVTDEIISFLQALAKQNEEQRLFQFLNELDKTYSSQQSQILLMNPLHSVVCSMIQQEELQRQVLEDVQLHVESSAMLRRNTEVRGTICGVKGHSKEKCWKLAPKRKEKSSKERGSKQANKQGKGEQKSFGGKTDGLGFKAANQAEIAEKSVSGLTAQQIDQLLKLLPALTIFHEEICLFQDCVTRKVKGVGEHRGCLYYLINLPLEKVHPQLLNTYQLVLHNLFTDCRLFSTANAANKLLDFSLCYKQLGHAPLSKLRHIYVVPNPTDNQEMCLTCPMIKFAKLAYDLSEYHDAEPFDLVHIDIWGAYRLVNAFLQ